MFVFRSPLTRLPITLLLVGLLGLSVLFIKNIITTTWQKDQREEALYLRSPNCFPQRDPSEVDASLPPCRNIMVTVVAKSQNTVVEHYRYRDYPRTHRFLALRDANGRTQTVGDIYADMWNSINVGDHVSVTLWRGQVMEVDANGYRSSIIDPHRWNRAEATLWPWIVTALLCSFLLSLMWRFGGGRAASSTFLV